MRKKLNAAAGLVTIAAAGALIASTPAFAEESIAPTAEASSVAVAVPAMATVGHQLSLFAGTQTLARDDGRRRHRYHRRHHRRHRHFRHHRHHRRHYRHYRHWY